MTFLTSPDVGPIGRGRQDRGNPVNRPRTVLKLIRGMLAGLTQRMAFDKPNSPGTVIVLAKCSLSREPFGIGFKRTAANEWTATRSFPIREEVAGSSQASAPLLGSFRLSPDFQGCPHCHSRSFFKDGCGRVACWDGTRGFVTCPWCGAQGELTGQITSVQATTGLD